MHYVNTQLAQLRDIVIGTPYNAVPPGEKPRVVVGVVIGLNHNPRLNIQVAYFDIRDLDPSLPIKQGRGEISEDCTFEVTTAREYGDCGKFALIRREGM